MIDPVSMAEIAAVVLSVLGGQEGIRYVKQRQAGKNGSASRSTLCPITTAGKTPLTKEEHKEICEQQQKLVIEKIDHLDEKIDWIKENMK